MSLLILLRHGQSEWNRLNRFTGWVDVALSEKGVKEAQDAGEKIKDLPIDRIFTSTLSRAQMTAMIAMQRHHQKRPVVFDYADGKMKAWGTSNCQQEAIDKCVLAHVNWHLNERYYGDLQGMNKDEAREEFGKEQVHIWRRSFDIPPPEGESLKMTLDRTLPYFQKHIVPCLEKGENILIAAHGNSLRSISMHLLNLSEEEVLRLEIPTGEPIIYQFEKGSYQLQNG